MNKIFLPIIAVVLLASCGSGQKEEKKPERDEAALMKKAKAYFKPLPEAADFNTPIAQLGKALYYETALSVNNQMSCNTCHMLDNFGVDNEATSPGHEGVRGDRNSPTVYNAWFHIAQFWDGRAEDLTEQAKGPILNPIEMGLADENNAVENIKAIEKYHEMFAAAFPEADDKITYHNIAEAIGAFEATLSTPGPLDQYLNGDESALTDLQKDGMEAFMSNGCITCHIGPGLGGQMYHKFGLVEGPYWDYTGSKNEDLGRFMVTEKESDKYFFKVPALRNVAKTQPYFHDGSVAELKDAVIIMGKTQLGRDIDEQEAQKIVAFLEALTGEIPAHALLEEKPLSAAL